MPGQKHIQDRAQDLVTDALDGLAGLAPDVIVERANRVAYRRPEASDCRVAVISGGGSGHEPAHAGFVGRGLLDAAVCGSIFASPNVKQIRRALDLVIRERGGLIVAMNYSGDALHFGLAASQHQAAKVTNNDVRVLLVGDDVSVGRAQGGIVGRRGMAGTVLVYKVAAALAAEGKSLNDIEHMCKLVCDHLGSIAVGLEHCQVPGTTAEPLSLGHDEIEFASHLGMPVHVWLFTDMMSLYLQGMGIHNESGTERLKMPRMSEIVDRMLSTITDTEDKDRAFVPFQHNGRDEVILLVNNLGGLSELEMSAVAGKSIKWLRDRQILPKRVICGTLMTALNMPGLSLSLLLLPRSQAGVEILRALDAPASALGWNYNGASEPGHIVESSTEESSDEIVDPLPACLPSDRTRFIAAITSACRALIEAEPEITRQDVIAGDGDAGLTLLAGAQGVLEAIQTRRLNGQNVIHDIQVIAETTEEVMGGTSGSLYSIFFSGLAVALRSAASAGTETVTPEIWAGAARQALVNLYKYTRARPPSRTLVDPLEAFVDQLGRNPQDLQAASQSALAGADATRRLRALAGRGSYVNQTALLEADIPDPGAWGIWRLVDGLSLRDDME